jgi:hypothetical protein
MALRVLMLLGSNVWVPGGGAWSVDGGRGEAHAPSEAERLAEAASRPGPGGTVVIFEPDGMAHQETETPKVGRSVFATLARVRSEFPVVASEDLGWGIESPEPMPGGSYSTLLHYELRPGLAFVREACASAGSSLVAAWSAYTAAEVCVRTHLPGSRARIVLFLLPGFVALAALAGGKRTFRRWPTPLSDRDWRALASVASEAAPRRPQAAGEPAPRRGKVVVVSESDPGTHCPVWEEIKAAGQVEAVLGLGALATAACQIPASHPANLAEAFPRPLRLDPYLIAIALAGIAASAVLGTGLYKEHRQLGEARAANLRSRASLDGRLAELARNRDEMASLRNEAPDTPGFVPTNRHASLEGLATAIPDSLTLTSFSLGRDNRFSIEAVLVGGALAPESLREALRSSGFTQGPTGSWDFDPATRRLTINGKFGDPQP